MRGLKEIWAQDINLKSIWQDSPGQRVPEPCYILPTDPDLLPRPAALADAAGAVTRDPDFPGSAWPGICAINNGENLMNKAARQVLVKAVACAALLLVCFITGCAWTDNFTSDPFTGGSHVTQSTLLNIPLPEGWQLYPSHSYSTTMPGGQREGLETYRSSVSPPAAAAAFFNTLSQHGWQLRLSLQKADRSVYLYQKQDAFAVLCFRRQGMLTILEAWTGNALPDGASIYVDGPIAEDPIPSLQGENFGPAGQEQEVESWGGTLQEREL